MTVIDRLFAVPSRNERLTSMEGLRGYAALIIYALHFVGQFYAVRVNINLDSLGLSDLSFESPSRYLAYWVFSSHYGVDIFFALSGYLIAGIVVKETFRYFPYLINRIVRIYPVLISSTFVYVAYRVVLKGGDIWWGGIVGNLLLLNGVKGIDFPAINIVTWSLFFELAFYISFPLIWLASGKSLIRFLCISAMVLLLLVQISDHYIRFAMFVAGVSLRLMPKATLESVRLGVTDNWVAVVYILACGSFMFTKNFMYFIPMFLIPCLLFIDRVLHGDGWLRRLFSLKIPRYFGNISFSFYIYHPLGLGLSRTILEDYPNLGDVEYFVSFAILSFIVSVLLAMISYLFIERLYFSNMTSTRIEAPEKVRPIV